jgi:alpha-galactosidase
VSVTRALSASVDLAESKFDMISLYGGHCWERQVCREPLRHGTQSVGSRRGTSSHHHNPFIALAAPHTTEFTGEVYGAALIYSGNFIASADVNYQDSVRMQIGIHPADFRWKLEAGETFTTPEAVLTYTDKGLNAMSQNFHNAVKYHLGHTKFRNKARPIVINNWEATYFNFNEEKLLSIIDSCKGLGIDTFVLDDGWFGKRDDDHTSLGDWFVDKNKLPNGLTPLIEKCESQGMTFGLWFEPEMISEVSELYKAHPDWCMRLPERPYCRGRNQLILDLSRDDVEQYLEKVVGDILANNRISYVKWDANRTMTEFCSPYLPTERQQETAHRYMLGVYELARYLTETFPNVFFEGCAGGGGRFDPAMLYYFPQIWTSDNSDAACRAYIQYGTSMCYPLSAMSGHISICPNHQVGRVTPMQSRMDMASFCATGYELNLHALTEEDFLKISSHITFYNGIQDLILRGDLYRLLSPFEGNYFSQMVVSKDKMRAVFIIMKMFAKCNDVYPFVKLKGLDKHKYYSIEGMGTFKGDVLMNVGLRFPKNMKDFETKCFTIEAVET